MDLSEQEQNWGNDLVKIVICEDQPMIVSGLERVLHESGKFMVIGNVNSTEALIGSLALLDADILILDLRMPGKDGLHALEWVARQHRNVKTVIFSVDDSPFILKKVEELGASAFVSKNQDAKSLLQVLERVIACEPFFAVNTRQATLPDDQHDSLLTPREKEILCLIVQGMKSKQIAAMLSLSENTVNTHRRNIMQKLGLHDTYKLIKYAQEHRICP
jgi:DNA-binding NarL/FixJ family response regulator